MSSVNTVQPTDRNGQSVPVLGLDSAVMVASAIPDGSAASAVAFPSGIRPGNVIRVAPSAPCHIAFGGAGVTVNTNSSLMMAPEYFKVLDGQTHYRVYGIEAGLITVTLAR
jgi:hypothetical protein